LTFFFADNLSIAKVVEVLFALISKTASFASALLQGFFRGKKQMAASAETLIQGCVIS